MRLEFAGRTALVTGAGGFVGANLVRALAASGAAAYGMVRKTTDLWRLEGADGKVEIVECDLCDFGGVADALATIKPDYIFHMATARNAADWRGMIDVNIAATLNLLRAAPTSALRRFVYGGGSMEYGVIPSPIREAAMVEPSTLFGATKAAATLLLQQAARSSAAPVAILRFFHVYGPFESPMRLVPSAIRAIRAGEPVPLTEPGLGHDFVFVDDVVEACHLAAFGDKVIGRVINIASGEQHANEAVVAMLGDVMNRQPIIMPGAFSKREWDRADWRADIARARELMGWRPRTDLRAGLRKFVDWIDAYDA